MGNQTHSIHHVQSTNNSNSTNNCPYLCGLRVNPDIARALKEEERGVLKDLRSILGKDVVVKPDVHLHHEQFDVMSIGG